MAHSRAHQIFRSRLQHLAQHDEVVFAGLRLISRTIKARIKSDREAFEDASIAETLGLDTGQYPVLSKPPARQWRKTMKGFSARQTREFALHLLYSYFEEYVYGIRSILPEEASFYPGCQWDKVEISGQQILDFKGDPDRMERILGTAARKKVYAEPSARAALERIVRLCRLGTNVDKEDRCNLALDLRNSIVHNGGVVSKTLAKKRGKLLHDELSLAAGDQVRVDRRMITTLTGWVRDHIADVDERLVSTGAIPENPK